MLVFVVPDCSGIENADYSIIEDLRRFVTLFFSGAPRVVTGQAFISAGNKPSGHSPGCPPLPYAAFPLVLACTFGQTEGKRTEKVQKEASEIRILGIERGKELKKPKKQRQEQEKWVQNEEKS